MGIETAEYVRQKQEENMNTLVDNQLTKINNIIQEHITQYDTSMIEVRMYLAAQTIDKLREKGYVVSSLSYITNGYTISW